LQPGRDKPERDISERLPRGFQRGISGNRCARAIPKAIKGCLDSVVYLVVGKRFGHWLMADLIEVAIEAALLTKVYAFAELQSITKVAKPNIQFEPDKNVTVASKWLRPTVLPQPTIKSQIGDDGECFYSGLLQIDCFMGQGAGLDLLRLAAAAVAFFPPGARLQLPELAHQLLIVEKAYPAGLFEDKPWSFIPVRVPYQLYA